MEEQITKLILSLIPVVHVSDIRRCPSKPNKYLFKRYYTIYLKAKYKLYIVRKNTSKTRFS
uniref:Uncharacterized protein n=1 Tax=Heterorhabditis bacteriophora TaxID=37862 RepID=A0A1I7W9B6_HETBA